MEIQPEKATAKTEDQEGNNNDIQQKRNFSAFASLGLLDRFLAVWIFLAMAVGIILGNFVPSMSPALEKGTFVLIWNALAGGNNDYCAILVAVNSILQMVLFAPLAIFFIRVISHEDVGSISYSVVATSVAAFLGIPLGAAVITRFTLRFLAGPAWYDRVFIRFASPWSLIGLLYTILVLFAAQGHQVVHQVVSVIRVAAPLIVYFAIVFFTTVSICRMLGFEYQFLVTQSFTAASNNFELAIAVAVATFGPNSDQALASTVGPLIEVPVLLGLVYALRWIAARWAWK
ncbi:hypothetical protein FP744_10005760 [Trichoderma asperellum]